MSERMKVEGSRLKWGAAESCLHFVGNGKWEVRLFFPGNVGRRALFAGFGGKFPPGWDLEQKATVTEEKILHFGTGEKPTSPQRHQEHKGGTKKNYFFGGTAE